MKQPLVTLGSLALRGKLVWRPFGRPVWRTGGTGWLLLRIELVRVGNPPKLARYW